MSDAPERVWIDPNHMPDHSDHFGPQVEYIRADLFTALEVELDRMRETLVEQSTHCTCHEAYSGRKMQDPECRAGEYGDDCRAAIGLSPLCQYNIRTFSRRTHND